MKFSLKITAMAIIFVVLAACSSSQTNALSQTQTQPAPTEKINTPIFTKTLSPSATPQPTGTGTPTTIPTATSTPFPTRQILLQFGLYGGDGGWFTDYYLGRDTPQLILYTDGQLLIQKEDDNGVWFVETTLTVPQMCAFLSQIERTGFFDLESNNTHAQGDPIYQFDNPTESSDGRPIYMIGVNGKRHKLLNIYSSFVQYLIPEAEQAFDLFNNYSPPSPLVDYQPQYIMLWIEKGPGDTIYSTPAPTYQQWPADMPPLEVLKENNIEMEVMPDPESQVSQVLIEGESVQSIFKLFGNRLSYRMFHAENSDYFVIARPLLPHETPDFIFDYPQDEQIDLPFKCDN